MLSSSISSVFALEQSSFQEHFLIKTSNFYEMSLMFFEKSINSFGQIRFLQQHSLKSLSIVRLLYYLQCSILERSCSFNISIQNFIALNYPSHQLIKLFCSFFQLISCFQLLILYLNCFFDTSL
ncbi:hypothetical protein TTHERM_000557909 (macronuclear) [Tetrahymena thermophila SB210]|uniref:Uncharacterized protein n=1 Tax=Tetrahymena thermophila (strain SB210) TaxID=312017 RepID=W7XHU3_TETTS|nr:hypothetical protein TTHERM_000557909 [Tetrahymena thermophila SB210]EWS72739.1 hypothetical protein TTHERM_000557909 [Tetrahymena thermophila SB210]|eukprot:XP_012654717.1 hypothetical protein TTHERM_000557909 [Tetrahymena thermophila SB210]